MSEPHTPARPGRPPVQADDHPPELRALLAVEDDPSTRETILKAFYGINEGAANSPSVARGVLDMARFKAMLRHLDAATAAISARFEKSSAEQVEAIRQDLRSQHEQGRKDERAERDKHRELLRSGIDENNQAYSRLHGERASLRMQVLMACGVTALVVSILSVVAMNHFVVGPEKQRADERVDAAQQASEQRYWKLFNTLPAAARLMADLQWNDGSMRIQQADGRVTGFVMGMGRLRVDAPRYAPDKNEITVPLAAPSPASKPKAAPTALVKGP